MLGEHPTAVVFKKFVIAYCKVDEDLIQTRSAIRLQGLGYNCASTESFSVLPE